ncbi:type I restriction enzyme, S subunit [Fibrobacter sp. UWCM]|uniref:restriction endonuclease subunit S n=1 Tax=Fibrobacter sp. UWCM TaxID=1896208 RepID=UPI000914B353|nr:restriction endonuclease subunit S [Fibrobacter sp. UWCM]SHH20779.1 type I restriction enzyme, S subunit [Fibrobacter sp. UWCM]
MRKYARYKDSGISWIGDVPEHWDVVPFRSEFSLGKGLPITKDNLINDEINGVPVVSYGQIHSKENEGTVLKRNLLRFVESSWLDSNPQSLLRKNDIVFADTSEDLDGCGNCVLNTETRKIFAGYHTIIAFTNKEENGPFFAYLFQSDIWRSQIRTRVNGVKVYSVTRAHLKRCKLLLPPLSEQKTIAEYLDKKTAQINELVSAKQKQIELLKEYKQSVIANAVTGKIDERREKRKWKDSGISWIGKIPENWEVKRVASFFDENKVLNKDFSFKKAYQFKFGTLVMKNEVGDEKDYEETYVKYTVLKKNDIVLNGLNLNYDFVSQRVAICPTPGIITSAYIAMTPRKTIEAMYYLWLFKTMDNKKMLHGMGSGIRLTLSFSDMKNQRIPVPPLSEQKEIVAYIEKKVSSIDSQIASIENQIANLNEYKQSLISDVVTGKVKVC